MATNDKALTKKEETIGRLYALRAGLSVIAQEKETADGIMEKAARDKESEIKQADTNIANTEKKIEELDEKIEKVNDEIKTATFEKETPGLLGLIAVSLFVIPLKVILIYLIPIVLIVFGSLQCAYYGQELTGFLKAIVVLDNEWGIEFIVGGAILAVILTIVYVKKYVFRFKVKPYWSSVSLSQKKEASGKLELLNIERKDIITGIGTEKAILDKLKSKLIDCVKVADEKIAEAKKQATEHAVAGLSMIYALEDSFGDMIDRRDWENTDVLIYALETRRADDVKEALKVVDEERRTERILEAVNTAGQEICKSINMGLSRLQGEMTRCFGLLGQIMVLQGDRIAGHMQDLQYSVDTNSKYMAQLSSQQNMSNALLAKANENSAALAAEVTQLRVGAEYAQARMLYGTN